MSTAPIFGNLLYYLSVKDLNDTSNMGTPFENPLLFNGTKCASSLITTRYLYIRTCTSFSTNRRINSTSSP